MRFGTVSWDPSDSDDRVALARFVLEGLDEIDAICRDAEDHLRRLSPSGDPTFDAHVSGDPGRVRAQVHAVFGHLQTVRSSFGRKLTYRVENPASRPDRQQIRLAREVLALGHSECLGWVLLLAGCLGHVGIHPLIIVARHPEHGWHAVLGYWKHERDALDSSSPVLEHGALRGLLDREALGIVNATRVAIGDDGGHMAFDVAEAEGATWSPHATYAIDIRAARAAGIDPALPIAACPINDVLAGASSFQERPELDRLRAFWGEERGPGLLALVGLGGSGKTSLVRELLTELSSPQKRRANGLLHADATFVWSFHERPDPDRCATELFNYLARKSVGAATFEQVREVLAESWRGCRVLLVLDGLERLQVATPEGTDQERVLGELLPEAASLDRFLRWLADGCELARTVLTTRFDVPALRTFASRGSCEQLAVGELPVDGARRLLRAALNDNSVLDWQLDLLVDEFGNHAQTLDLLGTALRIWCGGDPDRWEELPALTDVSQLPGARSEAQGRLRVLRFYEQHLPPEHVATLQLLSLFRVLPVTEELLFGACRGPTIRSVAAASRAQLRTCVLSLVREYRLVSTLPGAGTERYTAHRAVSDYFYERIEDRRSWHRTLAEQLATRTARASLEKPTDNPALDLLHEQVVQTLRAGDPRTAFELYYQRLGAYGHLGKRMGQFARGDSILASFPLAPAGSTPMRPAGLAEDKAMLFANERGLFRMQLGKLADAARFYDAYLGWARRLKPDGDTRLALIGLAECARLRGRMPEAERLAEEAVHTPLDLDPASPRWRAQALALLAVAQAERGRMAQALESLERSAREQDALLGTPAQYSIRGVWAAQVLASAGALQGAAELNAWNLQVCEHNRYREDLPYCHLLAADFARRRGELDAAWPDVRRAIELATESDAQEVLGRAHLAAARLCLAADRLEACRDHIRQGLGIAETCEYGALRLDLLVAAGAAAGAPDETVRRARTVLGGGDGWLGAADEACDCAEARLAAVAMLERASGDSGHGPGTGNGGPPGPLDNGVRGEPPPDDPIECCRGAVQAALAGYYDNAILLSERVLEFDIEAWTRVDERVRTAKVHAGRCWIASQGGEVPQHSAHADWWGNVGVDFGRSGEHQRALYCFEVALSLNPADGQWAAMKRLALRNLGR